MLNIFKQNLLQSSIRCATQWLEVAVETARSSGESPSHLPQPRSTPPRCAPGALGLFQIAVGDPHTPSHWQRSKNDYRVDLRQVIGVATLSSWRISRRSCNVTAWWDLYWKQVWLVLVCSAFLYPYTPTLPRFQWLKSCLLISGVYIM